MVTKKKILFEGDPIPVSDLTGNPSFASMTTDQINEKTADQGVTIEGVLLKDGNATPMGGAPAARVYHSADQSIPTATNTQLAFNSERFDNDGIHHPTTNNGRLTCKTAGKYLISVNLRWANNGTGIRQVTIVLNGSTYIGLVRQGAHGQDAQTLTILYDLAVNDYVYVDVRHTRGSALNVVSLGNQSPEFSMVRVA